MTVHFYGLGPILVTFFWSGSRAWSGHIGGNVGIKNIAHGQSNYNPLGMGMFEKYWGQAGQQGHEHTVPYSQNSACTILHL